MRDKSIGSHPPSVLYSKENSESHWTSTAVSRFRHKEHSSSSCFETQDSLLTAIDYLLNH